MGNGQHCNDLQFIVNSVYDPIVPNSYSVLFPAVQLYCSARPGALF